MLDQEQVARVCHEANRAICEAFGDKSQVAWEEAPAWQLESAIKGVSFCVKNPGAPTSATHDSWFKEKESDGWKYGPVKNPETKEHPCMVPYDKLPPEQKVKDYVFKAIVTALLL